MRTPDWTNVVINGIKANRETPFVWGETDCCLTIANIVKDYTGNDFAKEFRGHYSTAIGSLRALKKYGKGSIKDTLDSKYEPITNKLIAGRGDIALVETDAGESLGIVFGEVVWAMSVSGLVDLPKSAIVHAWRVE